MEKGICGPAPEGAGDTSMSESGVNKHRCCWRPAVAPGLYKRRLTGVLPAVPCAHCRTTPMVAGCCAPINPGAPATPAMLEEAPATPGAPKPTPPNAAPEGPHEAGRPTGAGNPPPVGATRPSDMMWPKSRHTLESPGDLELRLIGVNATGANALPSAVPPVAPCTGAVAGRPAHASMLSVSGAKSCAMKRA